MVAVAAARGPLMLSARNIVHVIAFVISATATNSLQDDLDESQAARCQSVRALVCTFRVVGHLTVAACAQSDAGDVQLLSSLVIIAQQ